MANHVTHIDQIKSERFSLGNIDAFTPLHNRILVERAEAVGKVGSIIIPSAAQEIPQRGIVRSVAKQVSWVGVGDVVMFATRGRHEVTHGGKLYNIIAQNDLYGVID